MLKLVEAKEQSCLESNPQLHTAARRIIISLAKRYSNYLTPSSLYTKADLIQEGWLVWTRLQRERRFDPTKASMLTLLHSSVTKRFNSVLRYESARCRSSHLKADFDEVRTACSAPSPERSAMIMQALEAIAEANAGVAEMIINGIPKELLAEARVNNRLRAAAASRNPKGAALVITPRMVRRFFKVNLFRLRQLANNYL